MVFLKLHPKLLMGGDVAFTAGEDIPEGWQRFWIENHRKCRDPVQFSRLSSNMRHTGWGEEAQKIFEIIALFSRPPARGQCSSLH